MIPADRIERARAVRIEDEVERRGIKLAGRFDRSGPCPVCGGRDRFAIHLRKQCFNCRGCGAHGDVIALAMFLDGCDFRAAVETLTGERAGRPPSEPRRPIPTVQADDGRVGLAARIWDTAVPIAGTAGEGYLANREIVLDDVPDHGGLRWLERCPWETGTTPCIVARYTDASTAEPRGIWRRPIEGGKPKSPSENILNRRNHL
jgi:CHC2 zinc finger